MLGETFLNTSSTSSSFLNSIEGDIAGEINGAVSDVAKALNLHDFYSAHILDYCEGYYTPTAVANATEKPSKNVTRCSNHTSLFSFNPTAILQSELRTGINLTDLQWPTAIQDAVKAVEIASKAMFILYCIGAGFAGLAAFGAIVGVLSGGRLSSLLNFVLDFVSTHAISAVEQAILIDILVCFPCFGNCISHFYSHSGKSRQCYKQVWTGDRGCSNQGKDFSGNDMGCNDTDALGCSSLDIRVLRWTEEAIQFSETR